MRIIKNEVIGIDEQTGMVLKKMITDKGEYLNRKLAVPNTIYICEKGRAKLNKSQIDSPFQTYHLKWNKNEEEWEFLGLKKAKQHAEKNNRLFIPFPQRNQDLWASLNWDTALEDFKDLLRKTDVVPFNLPLTASLEEWEMYKAEASKILTENKILIPIISTKHDVRHFPNIVKQELTSSKLLGLSCYELTDTIELLNLGFLKSINSKLKVGDSCALIVCFNYPRVMSRHLQIAGSFAFNCFGGDVFSQTKNFSIDFEKLEELKPEDIYCYDNKEKKFTKSNAQKERYGFDITNGVVGKFPVSEGLDFHQAIKYLSHILQQKDLDLINDVLTLKQPLKAELKNYTGWNVFLNTISSQILKVK